jgi:Tfp pilus assembly protein PilX
MQSQSGVTLIISLVLLLLLTLIAVSSMKTTGLQEKMAGNDRDRNLAFQAAEAALGAGVRKLEDLRIANTSIQTFCNGSVKDGVTQPTTPGLFHQVQITTDLTTTNKTSVDIDGDAFCQPCTTACPVPNVYTAATWTNANSFTFNTGNTLLSQQPRYFLTYVKTDPYYDPTCNASYGGKECPYHSPIYIFIVTARGTGVQEGTEVVLQDYVGGTTEFSN